MPQKTLPWWNTNQDRLDHKEIMALLNTSVKEDISKTFWKKRTVTDLTKLDEDPNASPLFNFNSDFPTSLVDLPTRHILVADTILTWSLEKSISSGRASQTPIQTPFHFHPADSNLASNFRRITQFRILTILVKSRLSQNSKNV